MSESIIFFVEGQAKGQPRPRAFARRMGSRFVARMYDDDAADEWKAAVDGAVMVHLGGLKPQDKPYVVQMLFYMERPAYMFTKKGEIKESFSRTRHTKKPDVDNLAKLVLDRITKSQRVWFDDSQVVHLLVSKQYADNQKIGAGVQIWEWRENKCIG